MVVAAVTSISLYFPIGIVVEALTNQKQGVRRSRAVTVRRFLASKEQFSPCHDTPCSP